MSVEHVCRALKSSIKGWSQNGLNEAQTSQVIVLRLFEALGYNIWNPDEVFPENHSGGGSGGYKPDYSVYLDGQLRFIVEVKALNKEFNENDKVQAVNYVNAHGLRWAVLTNGREWYFFDNHVARPVQEKHKLTVDLQDNKAAVYLEKLLAKELWKDKGIERAFETLVQDIDADIRCRTKLSEVEKKLSKRLGQGFSNDRKGLETAVQYALEPNERELAEESLDELARRLLPSINASVVSTDTESAVKEGIELTSSKKNSTQKSALRAWINGEELSATSWRDMNAGTVEALLLLSTDWSKEVKHLYRTTEEHRKASGEPYKADAYRQMSNGYYLLLHASADAHQNRARRMLEAVGAPPKLIRIVYKNEEFFLP